MLNAQQIQEAVVKLCPASAACPTELEALPYPAIGVLALAVRDAIASGRHDEEWLASVFDLLNRLGESGDPELENLLQVGVLEIFKDDLRVETVAQRRLGRRGKELLRDAI